MERKLDENNPGFDMLFTLLSNSLEEGKSLNTTTEEPAKELSIPHFLYKIGNPVARKEERIPEPRKPTKLVRKKKLQEGFEYLCKNIVSQSDREFEFLYKKYSDVISNMMKEYRKFTFSLIAELEKDKIQTLISLNRETELNLRKKKNLQEEFLWKRLGWTIEGFTGLKVTENQDVKKIVQDKFNGELKVKRAFLIEKRADVLIMPGFNSVKRFEISEPCKNYTDSNAQELEEVFKYFAAKSERPNHAKATGDILNRTCKAYTDINYLSDVRYSPLTMYIYTPETKVRVDSREEVSNLRFSTEGISCSFAGTSVFFKRSTVEHLGEELYAFDTDENSTYVRCLTGNEVEALRSSYTAVSSMSLHAIPEVDPGAFQYSYCLVKHGPTGRNWLIQLQSPSLSKPANSQLCNWEGCFSAQEKPKTLKKLSLCARHTTLSKVLKVPPDYRSQVSLWNAVLRGISWQEELSENSSYGKLVSGAYKQKILDFAQEVLLILRKKAGEKKSVQFRLSEQIQELKGSLDNEHNFTYELKQLVSDPGINTPVCAKQLNVIHNMLPTQKLKSIQDLKNSLEKQKKPLRRPSSAKHAVQAKHELKAKIRYKNSPYTFGVGVKKGIPHSRVTLKFNRINSAVGLERNNVH